MTDAEAIRYRIAEHLIGKKYRYLERSQLGALSRNFKVPSDEVRRAAILADRLRRARQAQQHAPAFRAEIIPLDEPIVLRAA